MRVADYLAELASEVCRCGSGKRARQTFCPRCYYALPPTMRRALYQRVGEGYEQSYAAAVEHLERTT